MLLSVISLLPPYVVSLRDGNALLLTLDRLVPHKKMSQNAKCCAGQIPRPTPAVPQARCVLWNCIPLLDGRNKHLPPVFPHPLPGEGAVVHHPINCTASGCVFAVLEDFTVGMRAGLITPHGDDILWLEKVGKRPQQISWIRLMQFFANLFAMFPIHLVMRQNLPRIQQQFGQGHDLIMPLRCVACQQKQIHFGFQDALKSPLCPQRMNMTPNLLRGASFEFWKVPMQFQTNALFPQARIMIVRRTLMGYGLRGVPSVLQKQSNRTLDVLKMNQDIPVSKTSKHGRWIDTKCQIRPLQKRKPYGMFFQKRYELLQCQLMPKCVLPVLTAFQTQILPQFIFQFHLIQLMVHKGKCQFLLRPQQKLLPFLCGKSLPFGCNLLLSFVEQDLKQAYVLRNIHGHRLFLYHSMASSNPRAKLYSGA